MAATERPAPVTERDGDWFLNLDGYIVRQCCGSYRFTVEFVRNGTDTELWALNLNGLFLYRSREGTEHWLDVSKDLEGCAPALNLFHDEVKRAVAYKDGHLEIEFVSGAGIEVPVDPGMEYESFDIGNDLGVFNNRGVFIVSNPEGGLSVWAPD